MVDSAVGLGGLVVGEQLAAFDGLVADSHQFQSRITGYIEVPDNALRVDIKVQLLLPLQDLPTHDEIVPARAQGRVLATSTPPGRSYLVDFPQYGATRWLSPEFISFSEGDLGPLRVILEDPGRSITRVRYSHESPDHHERLGEHAIRHMGSIDMEFSDGLILRVYSTPGGGRLKFDVLGGA